jgi:gas vesicle protein
MRDQYGIEGEDMMTTNGGGSFVMGMICGAAVGAALGLLFAPKAGLHMRKDLKQSAQRLSRKAMKLYDQASDTASRMADRGADALERASAVADDLSSRARAGVDDLSNRVRS